MSQDSPSASRDILPMTVANMTFLINRLGDDCGPLQFVRELTQNGLDAIKAMPDGKGSVTWDLDWSYFTLLGSRKLACIDTGAGMTGPDMVRFINELSSSMHTQSAGGNFGVGAKIAAAPRNPHGMVYKSWRNGIGHMNTCGLTRSVWSMALSAGALPTRQCLAQLRSSRKWFTNGLSSN